MLMAIGTIPSLFCCLVILLSRPETDNGQIEALATYVQGVLEAMKQYYPEVGRALAVRSDSVSTS
jgi:hypothetical protein